MLESDDLEPTNDKGVYELIDDMEYYVRQWPSNYDQEYKCNIACYKKCKVNLKAGLAMSEI